MISFEEYSELFRLISESTEIDYTISEEEMSKAEKEFYDWENTMNRQTENIGKVGSYSIIRSGHLDTPRYPSALKGKMTFSKVAEEQYPLRGDHIEDKTIVTYITKAYEKYGEDVFKNNKKVMIIYKNKKKTYDTMSVRLQGNEIHVITAIQGKKFSPSYKPQEGQYKVIVEKEEILILNLEESEEE